MTKAGGCARCRRPLPLQELHLLQHHVPQHRAQSTALRMATSSFPHTCCSAAVSWACAMGLVLEGMGLDTQQVCPKSGVNLVLLPVHRG